MPKRKLSTAAQMFKLAISGLPDSYWQQEGLPEKLATLVDMCINAERISREHPAIGALNEREMSFFDREGKP